MSEIREQISKMIGSSISDDQWSSIEQSIADYGIDFVLISASRCPGQPPQGFVTGLRTHGDSWLERQSYE